MSKVIVTFEKNWRGYAAGETAGFDSAVAEGLLEAGYAVEAGKQSAKKGKANTDASAPAAKKQSDASVATGTENSADQSGADGKP